MYKHILIATDGSELSMHGLDQGLALARAVGARVTVITATEPWQPVDAGQMWGGSATMLDDYRKTTRDAAERILADATERAAQSGVACETRYVPDAYPADAILESVPALGVDLIVMSSHGRRGLGRLLLGSQTHAVITHTKVPVLVVR